jgi:hypothetical protein
MARRGGRGDPISFIHSRLIIGEGPHDSDKNARDSFREVADLVRNVRAPAPDEPPHSYPVPTEQHKRADGNPSITILMVPWKGKVGALETLCLKLRFERIQQPQNA